MKILALTTQLFPGRDRLEDALAELEAEHEITREETGTDLTDQNWDRIVQAILSADRVLVL